MNRVYRTALDYHDDMRTNVPSLTVIETEPVNHFSGLLDARGNKLMVTVQPNPVGFIVFGKDKR